MTTIKKAGSSLRTSENVDHMIFRLESNVPQSEKNTNTVWRKKGETSKAPSLISTNPTVDPGTPKVVSELLHVVDH